MSEATSNAALIAKHVRKISHRADITRGDESVLLAASESIERLAAAIEQSARGLADGREDNIRATEYVNWLRRKLYERDGTIYE